MATPDRDSLHQLVDTLPEAALEAVEGALQHFQTWPPERPPLAKQMRDRVRQIIAERTGQSDGASRESGTGGGGYVSGTIGGGHWTGDGDGVAKATSGLNDGTDVTIELRRFRGQELQIERRLGVSGDKRKLLYALRIKGPDGKEDRREIEFDIADDSPPAL